MATEDLSVSGNESGVNKKDFTCLEKISAWAEKDLDIIDAKDAEGKFEADTGEDL